MNANQLKELEAELQQRGYKKCPNGLGESEAWAWLKSFDKKKDEDGENINGYQIAFRVWDFTRYIDRGAPPYYLDFWTSALGTDCRRNANFQL